METKKQIIELIKVIDKLENAEYVRVHNEFCEKINDLSGLIFEMDCIDSLLENQKPIDILKLAYYGNFIPISKFFKFDSYGYLQTEGILFNESEMIDIVEYCIAEGESFGIDEIAYLV